jgi:hypothetical protein
MKHEHPVCEQNSEFLNAKSYVTYNYHCTVRGKKKKSVSDSFRGVSVHESKRD